MENYLDNALMEEYRLVRVLKNTEHSYVAAFRHKALGKALVKRVYQGADDVFMILRSLSHPNILRVYDVYRTVDNVIVLEEYIEGQTITEVLEIGLYEPKGAVRVLSSLCDALFTLHARKIIHRDIKPENVMIDRAGTVKLIDFDAARVYKPYQSEDTCYMGTPGYVAPEQFSILQTDERADIYAMGILLNVMLTGEHPSERLYTGKLERIIKKCVHPDRGKRYQSAADLQIELRERL